MVKMVFHPTRKEAIRDLLRTSRKNTHPSRPADMDIYLLRNERSLARAKAIHFLKVSATHQRQAVEYLLHPWFSLECRTFALFSAIGLVRYWRLKLGNLWRRLFSCPRVDAKPDVSSSNPTRP